MKYFTCILDNGDGSFSNHNFKTEEDAIAWAKTQHDFEEWDCYPYGPLTTVDTESKYFWSWPDPWGT